MFFISKCREFHALSNGGNFVEIDANSTNLSWTILLLLGWNSYACMMSSVNKHGCHFVADSDTKNGFSQLTVGIQTSSFNMLWPGLYPSLCQKMVEIGPVVFEIWDQMWCGVVWFESPRPPWRYFLFQFFFGAFVFKPISLDSNICPHEEPCYLPLTIFC